MACSYGEDKRVLHRRSKVNDIRNGGRGNYLKKRLTNLSLSYKNPSQGAAIYSVTGFARYSHLRSIVRGIKQEQSTKQPLRMKDLKLNKCIDLTAAELNNDDGDAEDDALYFC